jgi:hypothetical protein
MDERPQAYSLFQSAWWWDLVAPGAWREARVEVDGQVRARWPYLVKRRYGLSGITAPPLAKWSGPWIDAGEGKLATRMDRTKDLLGQLVAQLPPHTWLAQNLHTDLEYWLPLTWHGFELAPRVSYEIIGAADEELCWQGVSDKTRNVVRKARRTLEVRPCAVAELLRMLDLSYRRQGRRAPIEPAILARVAEAVSARGQGGAIGAWDGTGALHAASLFVWDDRRTYYLVGGGDPALRNSGAASLLLWDGIVAAGRRGQVFDFEGSMNEAIERFFRGFGATPRVFMSLRRTRGLARMADALRRLRPGVDA